MPTDGKPKNGIVRQLFSYGGVSAMQTFVEFGVFAVLQLAGLPFRLANAVAVFCSGSFNYVMNRNVTFKSSSNYARSIAMFVAMYCWNLLFSNLMMAWIPGLLGWPTMAVKIVTMGMQAVWGFLLCRYVIFKWRSRRTVFPPRSRENGHAILQWMRIGKLVAKGRTGRRWRM